MAPIHRMMSFVYAPAHSCHIQCQHLKSIPLCRVSMRRLEDLALPWDSLRPIVLPIESVASTALPAQAPTAT